MVKHFTVLGYEFKNVFLMTELNVKIEIRKTAIQRKIKKKIRFIRILTNPKYQWRKDPDPWFVCTGDINND